MLKPTQFSKKWVNDLDRHLTIEDIQMMEKYRKRNWISTVVREMQIKVSVWYH